VFEAQTQVATLGLRTLNQKVFGNLSARSRHRKGELLGELFALDEKTRILDVGGQLDPAGRQILDTHPHRHNVTVLNLDQRHLDLIREAYPEVTTVQGDATRLPFEDDSFDLVYSNAVIEHIPTWEGQQAMAQEIQRVGKTWFVTTPNRWYPFEFHTRLPFVSWLPAPLMKTCSVVSYNHVKKRYDFGLSRGVIRLLSIRQMRSLFPTSLAVPLRITFWPETIIVGGPSDALRDPSLPRVRLNRT
jgi:hypothetical protein